MGINKERGGDRAAELKVPATASRDLFLSHRGLNKDIVRDLAGDIEGEMFQDRNLLTWADEAEIRPGQSIPGMVNSGLECSRFIGLVMTPEYFDPSSTGWTDAEWHAALHLDPDNRRARIIPLLMQDRPYIPMLLDIWPLSTCAKTTTSVDSDSCSRSCETNHCHAPCRIEVN